MGQEQLIKNENILKFLEKVGKDKELQDKLSKIRNPDEAYKLASSVQDGFTKEEFDAEMQRLYAEAIKDISEDDIAKIAGGLSGGDISRLVTGITSVGGVWAAVSAVHI